MDLIGLLAGGQGLRHEAELDHGTDAGSLIRVKDSVENFEVIHRFAVCVEREYVR